MFFQWTMLLLEQIWPSWGYAVHMGWGCEIAHCCTAAMQPIVRLELTAVTEIHAQRGYPQGLRPIRSFEDGPVVYPKVTLAISFRANCRALFKRCVTLSSTLLASFIALWMKNRVFRISVKSCGKTPFRTCSFRNMTPLGAMVMSSRCSCRNLIR